MTTSLILICAWAIDTIYGEYPNRWHPVVWMGNVISRLTHFFLGRGRLWEKLGSWVLLIGVTGSFTVSVAILIDQLAPWSWLQFLLSVFFLKASFALKALTEAAQQVHRSLETGCLREAQDGLLALCSRDPSRLDAALLTEASISSLAENLSDSVIAPLFYFALFGVPGAIAYRAVNTLDAMVGYKNHLRELGFASARCDDVLNWIPARITALLLLAASVWGSFPSRHGWKVACRDHRLTPSPNGGWPMAMMAGLLRIQLRKPGVYVLGDAPIATETFHFLPAIALTRRAAWIGFAAIACWMFSRGSLV